MVNLINRRNYWVSVNESSIILENIGGVVTVPPGQPVTQAELEAMPEQDVQDYLDNLVLEEALDIANEELFILTEADAELAYWVDKTPQDVTNIIAVAPNTFVSFKQMIEKNAQSIRVIAIFLKLMRDTGRL